MPVKWNTRKKTFDEVWKEGEVAADFAEEMIRRREELEAAQRREMEMEVKARLKRRI